MKRHYRNLLVTGLAMILFLLACTPPATEPAVDVESTLAVQLAVQLAAQMLTQTAVAASPTPLPPTITPTDSPTETPTIELTKERPKRPAILKFTGCYYGPGLEYGLDSNIDENKKVEIVGIGSVPGWYVIINPYFHKQCWVAASDIWIDSNMDLTWLPVMTPQP